MDIAFEIDDTVCLQTLARAPQAVIDALKVLVDGQSIHLQGETKEHTPTGATGLLRESIHAQKVRVRNNVVKGGVFTAHPYAAAVEYGTRPHMPPVAPIVPWVKVKFALSQPEQAIQIAYAIARKISKRGTKPQKFMQQAADHVRPEFQQAFKTTMQRVIDRINRGQL